MLPIRQPAGLSVRLSLVTSDGERSGHIAGAVAALPEQARRVLVLSDVLGLPDLEVAGLLGVTLHEAETLLIRARRLLVLALEGAPDRQGTEQLPVNRRMLSPT